MLFKSDAVSAEFFASAHPEVRALARELDEFVEASGIGPLVITDVMRTPDFYGDKPPPFSFHYVGCALDIRTKQWRPSKKILVRDWLKKRFPKSEGWDVLLENLGQDREHIHVELENEGLKRDWLSRRKAGVA
jgi:hypothetical protein